MFWCLVNVIFSLHVAVYQYLRKQHVIKVFFLGGGGRGSDETENARLIKLDLLSLKGSAVWNYQIF